MNKGRLEPLGVPGSDYDYDEQPAHSGGGSTPNALDRWVLSKLTSAISEKEMRILLWDQQVPQIKLAGARNYQKSGFRIFAVVDNEPDNLQMISIIRLFQADTDPTINGLTGIKFQSIDPNNVHPQMKIS